MFMAMQPELALLSSTSADFSRSNDESVLPKYRNIRFDFCEDDDEMPESDDEACSVKLPSLVASDLWPASGFFLCLISDVRTTRMTTANVVPVMMATSSRSPCD